MIVAISTAGFFTALVLALRFSSWAESWLGPGRRGPRGR